MQSIAEHLVTEEDLDGWIPLESLIESSDLVTLITDAYSYGVASFKIIDMKPYIPEDLKPRILSGLATSNEG